MKSGETTGATNEALAASEAVPSARRAPRKWDGWLTPAILLRRSINNAAGEPSEPAAFVLRRQQQLLVTPLRGNTDCDVAHQCASGRQVENRAIHQMLDAAPPGSRQSPTGLRMNQLQAAFVTSQ